MSADTSNVVDEFRIKSFYNLKQSKESAKQFIPVPFSSPFFPSNSSIEMKMTDTEQVRNDPVYKDIMSKVQEKYKSYGEELFYDDPFDV